MYVIRDNRMCFLFVFLRTLCLCNAKKQNWLKILHTDIEGDEIFGTKVALKNEVLNGSEIRIVINGWFGTGYVPTIHNIQVVQENICVQSVFNIGRNRLGHFDNQTYWSFDIFCSSGKSHTSRYIASSTFRPVVPETHSRVEIVWFARKLLCNEETVYPVYCNNHLGVETCGSRYNLARDVNNGADLRLVDSRREYVTSVSSAQTTSVGNIVTAQCLMHLSQYRKEHSMVFKPKIYWWYSLWSSNATCDMLMTGVARRALLGHFTEKRSINWFSDGCWKMVYAHDGKGRELSGSLATLIDFIRAGHRIKVKIKNYTIEADNILIQSGHVSAQLLWFLAQNTVEHFKQKPSWWVWEHVSTSGLKESKIYRLGIINTIGSTIYPVEVSWYADLRKWRNVYSNDKEGKAIKGTKTDLVHELLSGRKLRYLVTVSEKEKLLLGSDSVSINRNQNVSSQSLRIINFERWGPFTRKFHGIPAWIFTEINTDGKVETRYSNVGNTKIHRRTLFGTKIDWFVN